MPFDTPEFPQPLTKLLHSFRPFLLHPLSNQLPLIFSVVNAIVVRWSREGYPRWCDCSGWRQSREQFFEAVFTQPNAIFDRLSEPKHNNWLLTLALSSGKHNVMVWSPSVRLCHRHTHSDSPEGSMRRRERTFRPNTIIHFCFSKHNWLFTLAASRGQHNAKSGVRLSVSLSRRHIHRDHYAMWPAYISVQW